MATTTNYGWTTPNDTDLVKDGAAAIRTLGSSVDTTTKALNPSTTLGDIEYRSATANTNTRLPIGTTGQILSVVAGVPAWVANDVGDITAVSAGTGISGGGTSGDITITNSMATAIDAKGDLIGGTGADTFSRLAVGANGTVLTADSAEATGLKWAAPAGGATFVGCQVYKSAAQTLTNNTETALTFNTERFDTDTFHDTSTNTSRMTIPSGKAGYYLVIATVAFGSNSTPARAVTLRLNGNEYAYLQQLEPVSNGGSITGGSYIINLAVADYIEIYVRQESGGNLNASSGSAGTSFTIQYLGA